MKDKTLHVAASPLSGTIFCGQVLKSGVWAANKQDVTLEAILAVVDHATKFGRPIEISDINGNILHKITVENYKVIK